MIGCILSRLNGDKKTIRFIAINDNYDNANTESSDSDSIVVPFKNLLNDSYCRDLLGYEGVSFRRNVIVIE